jgi:hypothetical protein
MYGHIILIYSFYVNIQFHHPIHGNNFRDGMNTGIWEMSSVEVQNLKCPKMLFEHYVTIYALVTIRS